MKNQREDEKEKIEVINRKKSDKDKRRDKQEKKSEEKTRKKITTINKTRREVKRMDDVFCRVFLIV